MDLYLIISVIAAVSYGISISLDKLFFSQLNEGLEYSQKTISIVFSIIFVLYGVILIPFTPINLTPKLNSLLLMLGAGVLYGIAMLFYYYAIQRESASKIGQIASLEAVTTPSFAIIFLGETPSSLAILAISLIIIGLCILLFDRGVARSISTAKFAVIPIIIAVLLWSAQDTTIKYITAKQNFYTLYFWMRLSAAIFLSSLLVQSETRNELKELLQKRRENNMYILGIAGVVNATALLLTIYAISLGPLSIVSPILAAYPIPTIIISLLFTKYTPNRVHKTGTIYLMKRILSILLFVSGITILTFV